MEKRISYAVLTISTRSSAGKQEDTSGPALCDLVKQHLGDVICYKILPDEKDIISSELIKICDRMTPDIRFTLGGGFQG